MIYLGQSDLAYQRRWSYPPRHLVNKESQPCRGEHGKAACGTTVNVMQAEYDPQRHQHICKRCLRTTQGGTNGHRN